MREELLKIIERNSRIDLKELAVILGTQEIDVVNELQALGEDFHREGFRADRGTGDAPERAGL